MRTNCAKKSVFITEIAYMYFNRYVRIMNSSGKITAMITPPITNTLLRNMAISSSDGFLQKKLYKVTEKAVTTTLINLNIVTANE